MEQDPVHSVELGEWKLLPERVAHHLPTGTLLVADLHVGYCRKRPLRGDTVPIHSLEEELAPLLRAWIREKAERLVIAGDLVEKARTDLITALGDWFKGSGIHVEGLVRGNHDATKSRWPFPLLPEGYSVGRHAIWHHNPGIPGPLVHGHEHPALPLPGLGMAPCFLVDDQRLILAAYSQNTSGRNIFRRKDLAALRGMRCLAVAGKRVEDLGAVRDMESPLPGQR